jgi:hypothetical protein
VRARNPEAGSAGKQPCRGITWRAHPDDEPTAGRGHPRPAPLCIGGIDPPCLENPKQAPRKMLVLQERIWEGYQVTCCQQAKALIQRALWNGKPIGPGKTPQGSSYGGRCAPGNRRARRPPSHASRAASMAASSCTPIAVVRSSMG